jgi:hypothetical protein
LRSNVHPIWIRLVAAEVCGYRGNDEEDLRRIGSDVHVHGAILRVLHRHDVNGVTGGPADQHARLEMPGRALAAGG